MQRPVKQEFNPCHHRPGFTLIEVMIVIVIIVTLMALLIPTLSNIQSSVRENQVVAEIEGLQKSITDFKATFGKDPPSRLTLYEDPVAWNTPSGTTATERERIRGRSVIRQIWPQFNFNLVRDIDNDGNTNEIFVLTGAECLVFFLGGIMDVDQPNLNVPPRYAARGFSKNPADPIQAAQTTSETRVGPFHEFVPGRFTDVDNDGMLEYADTLPNPTVPYLYISSREGVGYDPQDLIVFDTTNAPFARTATIRDMKDAYRQGSSDLVNQGVNAKSAFWKPQTYQIISPGRDREYGNQNYNYTNVNIFGVIGGGYDQEIGVLNNQGGHSPERAQFEADNITNFSSGTLE